MGRGHDVTAIVRGENGSGAEKTVVRDAMEIIKADLAGFDVVVDVAGAWTPETVHIVPDVANLLATLLKGTSTRLIVVGGAGSLFVDKDRTKTVADVTPFPKAVIPMLEAHQRALDDLHGYDDVEWTYISPAGDF